MNSVRVTLGSLDVDFVLGAGATALYGPPGAGKTLLPGLIDSHVHLAASGGYSTDPRDYNVEETMPHSAAALLYSGITAARRALARPRVLWRSSSVAR